MFCYILCGDSGTSELMVDGLAFTSAMFCLLFSFSLKRWFGLHFIHILSGFVQLLIKDMVDRLASSLF